VSDRAAPAALEAAPSGEAGGAAAASAPRASVIIPARNRRAELEAALDSLDRQCLERGGFEVVVVDDGSTDGTTALLEARGARAGAGSRLTTIRNERPAGPGAARNAAARRARGEALVFLDSDCTLLPGWLEAMTAPRADPRVGAVGGAEVLDPTAPLLDRVLHFALTSALTTGRIRGGSGRRAARYRPRTFSMAVRREVFERAGGFAALLNGEDIDLAVRIEGLGLDLVFAPGARVHHRRRPTLRGFARQAIAMGRARASLIRRDPRHVEPIYLAPAALALGLAALGVAALVAPGARPATALVLAAGAAYLALAGIAAAASLRDPAALLLSPLAVAIQHLGYGLGSLVGALFPWREAEARRER
jgi:GT2 family glycosyltransferase